MSMKIKRIDIVNDSRTLTVKTLDLVTEAAKKGECFTLKSFETTVLIAKAYVSNRGYICDMCKTEEEVIRSEKLLEELSPKDRMKVAIFLIIDEDEKTGSQFISHIYLDEQ